MILNSKYKVWWTHYNHKVKEKEQLTIHSLIDKINDIVVSSSARADIMPKVKKALLHQEILYTQSFSTCTIEELDEFNRPAQVISTGMALVHPKDNFDRKKGVLISFKDAVSKISDKNIRTAIWKDFLGKVGKYSTMKSPKRGLRSSV